jgi:hypothetical protein
MQTQKIFSRPKPILKTKPQQLAFDIEPQPPTANRLPPNLPREKISPNPPPPREKISPFASIDYDKLTPTQQAKWDAGIFGAIHLRDDVTDPYYCVRWTDPVTKRQRSKKLHQDYDRSKAILKKLIRQK